jgi:alpha-L-rhamnosidase
MGQYPFWRTGLENLSTKTPFANLIFMMNQLVSSMNRSISCLIFLGCLLACTTADKKESDLAIRAEFIYDTASFASCHASSIAETPTGLVAAWFGGTEEKHPDVEIWLSRHQDGAWTAPVSVANGIQNDTLRYPCWNPVLFQYPGGPLMLFYKVGPDPVEWWGEYIVSNDNGLNWSQPVRLPEGVLGPIKNKPVLLPDGRLISPSSTENKDDGRWQVHLEISSDTGRTWTRTAPLNDGIQFHIIQPSLLTYGADTLQLVCRSMENRLVSLWSFNNGQSWEAADTISVPNPNSGTDAVTLQDGRQLLVYNPTERYEGKWGGPRSPLSVAISTDGKKWEEILQLETEPGEFSYPAVIQSADGKVHITYTWKREKIRYVELSL